MVNGQTKAPRQPSLTARSSSRAAAAGSPSERCAIGIRRLPEFAAEVGDPAVVGAAIGVRELAIEELRFPQEAKRRIEHRLRHSLAVQELHALFHIHRAERGAFEIRLFGRRTKSADFLGRDVAAHRAFAELARLLDSLAHAAERRELAGARDRGGPPIDQQLLEAVVGDADAERAVAIDRLQVGLPEVRRLEDVPIAIDHERSGHRILLRPQRVKPTLNASRDLHQHYSL